jgi:hypothetical protein
MFRMKLKKKRNLRRVFNKFYLCLAFCKIIKQTRANYPQLLS